MQYIIDANNLSGALEIINEKGFDKILIEKIKKYNEVKRKNIFLVFDGQDIMGDKYSFGKITIIYSPKDSFYKSADDKIVELAQDNPKQEKIIITDDIEIKTTITEKHLSNVSLESTADFINRLDSADCESSPDEVMPDSKKQNLEDELLTLWTK